MSEDSNVSPKNSIAIMLLAAVLRTGGKRLANPGVLDLPEQDVARTVRECRQDYVLAVLENPLVFEELISDGYVLATDFEGAAKIVGDDALYAALSRSEDGRKLLETFVRALGQFTDRGGPGLVL